MEQEFIYSVIYRCIFDIEKLDSLDSGKKVSCTKVSNPFLIHCDLYVDQEYI